MTTAKPLFYLKRIFAIIAAKAPEGQEVIMAQKTLKNEKPISIKEQTTDSRRYLSFETTMIETKKNSMKKE